MEQVRPKTKYTTDVAGPDKRKTKKEDRGSTRSQDTNQKCATENKTLKAQAADLLEPGKSFKENFEDNSVAIFAALLSTLEKVSATSANVHTNETLYTIFPRNIIDSGARMTFVRSNANITNARKHVRLLLTAEDKT